jgi:hypothetical protein
LAIEKAPYSLFHYPARAGIYKHRISPDSRLLGNDPMGGFLYGPFKTHLKNTTGRGAWELISAS